MSKNDFSLIEKYTSKYLLEDEINNLYNLKKALGEDDIVITCMGLYNHGKSSLLNILVEDYEDKTFTIADTRETTKNKKIKHGNIIFVDTPGLNAQKDDDKNVMEAAKESDINIFVHNINTGEFVASEVDFFHNIKQHWKNPQEFIARTIFVLSRIDEIQNYDDIKNTAAKMKEQIKNIFEVDVQIIPVSSKVYKEGMIEKDDEIVEESNFVMLKEKIQILSMRLLTAIQETKKERIDKCNEGIIQSLRTSLEKNKLELTQYDNEQSEREKNFQNDLKKIETALKNKYNQLKSVYHISIFKRSSHSGY